MIKPVHHHLSAAKWSVEHEDEKNTFLTTSDGSVSLKHFSSETKPLYRAKGEARGSVRRPVITPAVI